MARDKFTKKEKSWILYDWANSIFATNIMAAIFPIIFVKLAGSAGDMWWGYATSFATFVVALLAPTLGAIADYKGMKKKLFNVFVAIGVIFTALIAATGNWRIMLISYVFSQIGFSGSNLFYDSFLTDVTTNERMDKVSSWGYAMGYIGGSTIPFIISIAVILWLGFDNIFAQKFSILITSVWWIVFTIPFIRNVDQVHYIDSDKVPGLKALLKQTLGTAKDIFRERGMFLFIFAYFFYIDGVNTVIKISTAYGSALGISAVSMILALLLTQFVAMPCSILFGKLAKKTGTRKALIYAIGVYMFICLVGFIMGITLEPHQAKLEPVINAHKEKAYQVYESYGKQSEEFANAYYKFLDKSVDAVKENEGEKLSKILDSLQMENTKLNADEKALAGKLSNDINALTLSLPLENKAVFDSFHSAISFSTTLFWAMAILVGTVQGGIQATSRSYFGKLIPKKRSNEYFGFFDIFGKFSCVIGPALYGLIKQLTGKSSIATITLMLLFLVGFITLIKSKSALEKLESSRIGE